MPAHSEIEQLKTRLTALSAGSGKGTSARFKLGAQAVDDHLDSGLCPFSLHEIHAETGADAAAGNAFALGLAMRAAPAQPLVWIVQDMASQETGQLFGPGLHELGVDLSALLMVRVKDAAALLATGEETLRSCAAGAVLMSSWGESRAMTLTASRRLSLAARDSGAMALMIRIAAQPGASAAATRWSVRSVLSEGLEANAPGRPAFAVSLLRSRFGAPPGRWIMEWDRERRAFVRPAPLSVGVVPLPADRPVAAGKLRRLG